MGSEYCGAIIVTNSGDSAGSREVLEIQENGNAGDNTELRFNLCW